MVNYKVFNKPLASLTQAPSTLTLLVLGIAADHAHHSLAAHDLAFAADLLH
jgi:hypothetical protein